MGKSTPKFVNGIFAFLLVLTACSGKEMEKEKKDVDEVREETIVDNSADTIWKEGLIYEFHAGSDFDESFSDTIDGELFTLRITSVGTGEEYVGIKTYIEDDKLYGQKYIGANSVFTFRLYDDSDKILAENSVDRYDLEEYVAFDLLAGSRGDNWNLIGYMDEFGSFALHTYWILEDSDVGEDYVVFLNRKMTFNDFIMNSFTGGDGCHCELEPSEDGKTFALCSRIHRSNRKHNELGKKDLQVTGSFVLNNDYSLVIYNYEGKPPYSNAQILDKRGVAVKKFDYTGISGALGFMIPRFKVDDQDALFLLDHEKRSLYRIDLNNPLQVDLIKIDEMVKMEEGEFFSKDDPAYLEISSETKGFTFEYKDKQFRYYGESKDW